MSKFSVGDKIVEKKFVRARLPFNVERVVAFIGDAILATHYGTSFEGTVMEENYPSEVGSRSWRSAYHQYSEDELLTMEEARQEQLRLEAEKSKLEDEFERVRSQVAAYINIATESMKSAALMAAKFDKDLEDMKQECRPLFKVLNDNGWRHSNMKC